MERFRFGDLGWFLFERLCVELLELRSGISSREWHHGGSRSSLLRADGIALPGDGSLRGPVLVVIAWLRPGLNPAEAADLLGAKLEHTLAEWSARRPRSLLVLTNASVDGIGEEPGIDAALLGPAELTDAVASSPELRFRVPAVLGVGEVRPLIEPEVAARSSGDMRAAVTLARVFVPTTTYRWTLDVLKRHHFTVLTGPPEMGKTAIARMVGLAALTAGWEFHECVRPADLWARIARERSQVFVADDAFGSTEYRPEAAERWALELDRVLKAMDERHWLLWTSRPTPLKAGLRRIHREHGVERFPQPAQVQVAASVLDASEKALILFRHAKAAGLSAAGVDLVRKHGWQIVSHQHFTPERIRRFVAGRLQGLLEPHELLAGHIETLVDAEIREPTAAMAASFHALSAEHRALLTALLDVPPGPTPERALVAAVRRHSASGFSRPPTELVDRLSDHFLRTVEANSVDWVHPSWRDLVIDELVRDPDARRRFLDASSLEGLLLALSVGGAARGDRVLPLLREDADWDALGDRLASLTAELDEPELTRLLIALSEARAAVRYPARVELDALTRYSLELIARRWNRSQAPIPVGLLSRWHELADRLDDRPEPPELGATWIELLPTDRVRLDSPAELARFDDWTALAELLHERQRALLMEYGFPDRQRHVIRSFVSDVDALRGSEHTRAGRELLVRVLRRLFRLAPAYARSAIAIAAELARVEDEPELPPYTPRPLSPELERILEAPASPALADQALVTRILRDL
jgi:hypothetical protein